MNTETLVRTADLSDPIERLMLADALEEEGGRGEEVEILRLLALPLTRIRPDQIWIDYKAINTFTRQYILTALWASTDDDETPLDENYVTSSIAPETLAQMIADCERFQRENLHDVVVFADQHANGDNDTVAHLFWLDRNGHGCGFWEYTEEEAERLSRAAKAFGEFNLYIGDDGKIYGT